MNIDSVHLKYMVFWLVHSLYGYIFLSSLETLLYMGTRILGNIPKIGEIWN